MDEEALAVVVDSGSPLEEVGCDCAVLGFSCLQSSSSVITNKRKITLQTFKEDRQLYSVCRRGHNTYQRAFVRHSLSLSYLRHNICSRWHHVSMLTSRGLPSDTAHTLDCKKGASDKSSWCLIHFLFICFLFSPRGCVIVWGHTPTSILSTALWIVWQSSQPGIHTFSHTALLI